MALSRASAIVVGVGLLAFTGGAALRADVDARAEAARIAALRARVARERAGQPARKRYEISNGRLVVTGTAAASGNLNHDTEMNQP